MKYLIASIALVFSISAFSAPQNLKDAINNSTAKNGGVAKLTADIKADLLPRVTQVFKGLSLDGFELKMDSMQCHETDSLWPVDSTLTVADTNYYGVCFVEGGKMMIKAKYALVISESRLEGFNFVELVIE